MTLFNFKNSQRKLVSDFLLKIGIGHNTLDSCSPDSHSPQGQYHPNIHSPSIHWGDELDWGNESPLGNHASSPKLTSILYLTGYVTYESYSSLKIKTNLACIVAFALEWVISPLRKTRPPSPPLVQLWYIFF